MEYIKTKVTLFAVLSFSSCGTFKVRSKDPAQLPSIKTVALVGMDVTEPKPKDIAFNLGSGKVEGERAMGTFQEKSQHVESMYSELHRTLGVRMKWKVLDRQSMVQNAGYQAAYKETMKGWQNKMPPGEGLSHYNVRDLLDWDSLRIMGPEGRDKLLKDLNVDAIMVAKVTTVLGGTSIMGFGPRHPTAIFSFQVYKKGIESPVWFDGNVKGKEGGSVGATALWDLKKMQQYSLDSAIDAFSKIDQERK